MNHLALENSPYLLQHADNPVDWHPWGEAAFEKARAEQKPIFLSVGYSTCHWCHVMAHESFENADVARVLNASYVAVKVDREERPDVDRVYMTFVQATTGGGGWPMSVWLTPQLEPFYGGTYFPPTARWGRPGFIEILEEIARIWRKDPDKVRLSAAQLTAQMRRLATAAGGGHALSTEAGERVLERATADLGAAFDARHGGFGDAPKFPRPSELLFLMREYARQRENDARSGSAPPRDAGAAAPKDMALKTLDAMARGGIRDHVGGGFHRYSVDARWHVPHFEKMLYDQAQLVLAYLDAFQVTADAGFADVAAEILEYVARDLAQPGGGFYSAEDADSVAATNDDATNNQQPTTNNKREGAFYLWTDDEFSRALGEDAGIGRARFGVRPDGNVESDPHGDLAGKNVLYLAAGVDEIGRAEGQPHEEIAARLEWAKARLFDARARRPRPGLDDKVIVAWNGLMIAAFARASRVLRSGGGWLVLARDAAAFIRKHMWDPARSRLLRRYRNGEAAIEAYAEDYACLVFGLLDLFQADADPAWLEWALALQRAQDSLFWDDSNGGWFSTTGDDASVLLRLKEDYDGAEPAASSIAAWNLLTLARLTGEGAWATRVERTFAAFSAQMEQSPRSMPMMLAALSTFLGRKHEIVIVGPEGRDDTTALLERIASLYLPFAVVVPLSPDRQPELVRLLPFVESMTMRDGRATAYVCQEFACRRPTADPEAMVEEITLR